MKHFVAVAFLVVAPSIPRPSGACSPSADDNGPHAVDPALSTDTVAPSAVDATVDIYRSDSGGGCRFADSCGGGFNTVQISINSADDRTPAERMGLPVGCLDLRPLRCNQRQLQHHRPYHLRHGLRTRRTLPR